MYRALLNPNFSIIERQRGTACVHALWAATYVLLFAFGIWVTAKPI